MGWYGWVVEMRPEHWLRSSSGTSRMPKLGRIFTMTSLVLELPRSHGYQVLCTLVLSLSASNAHLAYVHPEAGSLIGRKSGYVTVPSHYCPEKRF